MIGGKRGYEQARHILSSPVGNEYVISHSSIAHFKSGKPFSSAVELQQLADDLAVAIDTLIELNMSSEIDNQRQRNTITWRRKHFTPLIILFLLIS